MSDSSSSDTSSATNSCSTGDTATAGGTGTGGIGSASSDTGAATDTGVTDSKSGATADSFSTTQPETVEVESVQPEATQPEVTTPEPSQSETAPSETVEIETVEVEAIQPEAAEPVQPEQTDLQPVVPEIQANETVEIEPVQPEEQPPENPQEVQQTSLLSAEETKPENEQLSREQLARDFYQSQIQSDDTRSQEQIQASIEQQLKGTDLGKEVGVEPFKTGDIFGQAREASENVGEHPGGNYFFKPGSDVERLGISGESIEGKERSAADFYVAERDGQMLKSTAKDADSWYRDGKSGELLYGGEMQYYTTDREAFSRIVDSARQQEGGQTENSAHEPSQAELSQTEILRPESTGTSGEHKTPSPEARLSSGMESPYGSSETWQEGFESPHKAFKFAEDSASAQQTHERISGAQTADSPADAANQLLSSVQKGDESPLGKEFAEQFQKEFGRHPFTESREARERELGK